MTRVPFTAGEKESLHASLDRRHDAILSDQAIADLDSEAIGTAWFGDAVLLRGGHDGPDRCRGGQAHRDD
jgi:hypothetical protein